jgi:hypothetical protein
MPVLHPCATPLSLLLTSQPAGARAPGRSADPPRVDAGVMEDAPGVAGCRWAPGVAAASVGVAGGPVAWAALPERAALMLLGGRCRTCVSAHDEDAGLPAGVIWAAPAPPGAGCRRGATPAFTSESADDERLAAPACKPMPLPLALMLLLPLLLAKATPRGRGGGGSIFPSPCLSPSLATPSLMAVEAASRARSPSRIPPSSRPRSGKSCFPSRTCQLVPLAASR